jgi:hypothetical protein
MTAQDLKFLYARELDNLHKEISDYTDENKIWTVKGDIKNTAGNLCLHLLGNLNHFIGTQIGNTGFIRNRDEEFAAKNISKEKLLKEIEDTKAMIEKVLGNTDEAAMQKEFPADFLGKRSTEFYLNYFFGHFMYHLGQINYHRRLV